MIEEQAGVPLYFAHAYSPHERGSNENRNRVLRRFIPKGQPIDEITDDELIQINWYLNCRPLKCLNWRTPIEIFLRNLRYQICSSYFLQSAKSKKRGWQLPVPEVGEHFLILKFQMVVQVLEDVAISPANQVTLGGDVVKGPKVKGE